MDLLTYRPKFAKVTVTSTPARPTYFYCLVQLLFHEEICQEYRSEGWKISEKSKKNYRHEQYPILLSYARVLMSRIISVTVDKCEKS